VRPVLIDIPRGLPLDGLPLRSRQGMLSHSTLGDASGLLPKTAQMRRFFEKDRCCFQLDGSQWSTMEEGRAGSLVFHNRILPLWSHEARVLPSGEKATALMRAEWPMRA
jgi:hypothetical protein